MSSPALESGNEPKIYPAIVHCTVSKELTENKRLMFIGDVHGCYDELMLLLDKAGYDPDTCILCFVGDLVGKGPKPREVVQFVHQSGAYCVRGNHDNRVVQYYYNTYSERNGDGSKTEHELLAKEVLSAEKVEFLATIPLTILFEEYSVLVVHAGLDTSRTHLASMDPNMLMNMRCVNEAGEPTIPIASGTPWAEAYSGNHQVVFGHDATQGLKQFKNALGLDSGCVYGKQLSLWILPGRDIVQIDALEEYAPP